MKILIRLGVVAFSALLVAAFVGYRAGAFDWVTQRREPPTPAEQPTAEAPPSVTILGGTKSKEVFRPAESKPPTIMHSSKSMAPLIPSTPTKPNSDPAPGPGKKADGEAPIGPPMQPSGEGQSSQPKKPVLLPGSKSAPAFSPPAPSQGSQAPTKPK